MATLLLSAAGAAAGASIGGTILGLGAAVIGQAVGATVGRVIDAKLLGAGSAAVETGRIDRLRLTGASEGTPIPNVHGRVRVAGQVIWASRFEETVTTESARGGKGSRRSASIDRYSYSVNLAIALAEGEITRLGRIWADGIEIAPGDLSMVLYPGSETQLPDPTIEAIEGEGLVPSYRGTAYVVISDLELGAYGNRVPQFTFEVMRTGAGDPATLVRAMTIGPGRGEYALATTPVHYEDAPGRPRSANVSTAAGEPDLIVSTRALVEEVPGVASVSVPVTWFASDIVAGTARVRPMVEGAAEGVGMAWRVSGMARGGAEVVAEGGGTPADASLIEALARLAALGRGALLAPVLAMDAAGRFAREIAPGGDGAGDVAAFFGSAEAGDFAVSGNSVSYVGPPDEGYRRFILHYAHLAALAGGVEAFLIGSDLRGLTRAAAGGGHPAVDALVVLAEDVAGILGPDVRIGYAADWSDYGARVEAPGEVAFPLDPLWASDSVDFIGINAYAPVSDWRETPDHADAAWGSVYSAAYLAANIAGGEGFDWTYRTDEAAVLQIRSAIEDPAYGEPWMFRPKDLSGWWSNAHYPRVGGVRAGAPTDWVPESKPIWFTEVGCPAVDKGTNAPCRSLEAVPRDTTGARDDLLQVQFWAAFDGFWRAPENNPVSPYYGGSMVDTGRMYAWQWDARPYPQFPGQVSVWGDGSEYARGHWVSGRMTTRSLAGVVREVCAASGVPDVDVSGLYGLVRGYAFGGAATAREVLQPLLLAAGADAIERDGRLVFRSRAGRVDALLTDDALAVGAESEALRVVREPEAQLADRVEVTYLEADGDYEIRAADSRFPDGGERVSARTELPLVLTQGEGRGLSERWLTELRVAREVMSFAVPPSSALRAGDVVAFAETPDESRYRIDRIEEAGVRLVEAVRIDAGTFGAAADAEDVVVIPPVLAPLPVLAEVMDLPLIEGEDALSAPWVVAASDPWPGSVAVYSRSGDAWRFEAELTQRAVMGETVTPLAPARPGLWDRGAPLEVRLTAGALSSVDEGALFSGGNAARIEAPGGGNWEVFQFRDAVLVAPDVWALSMRLRGQAGTDGLAVQSYPTGARVVIVDGALLQLNQRVSQRGVPREYRIGPSSKPVDHPAFQTIEAATDGVALRPYAPVHVGARRLWDGAVELTWIRRTRIDGDGWEALEVPLGEVGEAYLLRVYVGGALRREVTVAAPEWSYGAAEAAADGALGPVRFEVAQISDRFGPGLFGKVELDD